MDVLTTLIVIAIVAIAAFFIAKPYFKEKSETTNSDIVPPSPEQNLLELNLLIRKAAIGSALTLKCETIIDQLIAIFPRVEKHECASGEFAWTVKRIATEYLPNKCVLPFIGLKDDARDGASEEFINNLQILEQELVDIDTLLSKNDKKEFENKSLFLKAKFNAEGKA